MKSQLNPDERNDSKLIAVIMSNNFEFLMQHLKAQLYPRVNIFTRKLLVLPGDEVKTSFEKNCLLDPELGLSTGYRSINLNLCIDVLFRTLFKDVRFPQIDELKIVLYGAIQEALLGDDPDFGPLKSYLSIQKDFAFFVERLSYLFMEYGLFGIEENPPAEMRWQLKLFSKIREVFHFPINVLKDYEGSYDALIGMEVHFFGITVIPPCYLRFIKKISSVVPLYFYLPSISRHHTLDFVSDYRILKHEIEVSKEDQNPFIANFGAVFNPLWQFLIDESSYQKEEWSYLGKKVSFESEIEKENPTLFEAFKQVLLDAQDRKEFDTKKTVLINSDFLIYEADHPYRETEHLAKTLQIQISEKKLKAHEILVLCPDLETYGPLIEYHFPSHGLGFSIDHPSTFLNEFDSELHLVYSLMDSRFEATDTLSILEATNLLKQAGIDEKSNLSIKALIQASSLTFGFDAAHRCQILQNCDHEDAYVGTVQHFFDQVYLGLVFAKDTLNDHATYQSHYQVDTSLSLHLGAFHKILIQIFSFKQQLEKNHYSLNEWTKFFLEFVLQLFGEEACETVRKDWVLLLESNENQNLDGAFYFKLLKSKLKKKQQGVFSREENRISVSPFKLDIALFPKFVWILGADDAHLPNQVERTPIDLTKKDSGKPSPYALQKGALLQALSFVCQGVNLSYSKHSQKKEDQALSFYVEKLKSFLDELFITNEGIKPSVAITKSVPAFSFSKENFYQPSFGTLAYQQYLATQEEPPKKFAFSISEKKNNDPLIISIKSLESLMKNPFRFFAQKTLGVYLPYVNEETEEFALSFQRKQALLKELLKADFQQVVRKNRFQGFFPHYSFLDLSLKNLYEEWEKIEKAKKHWGLSSHSSRNYTVTHDVQSVQMAQGSHIFLPPIELTASCGKRVQIVGKIQESFSDTLWLPHKLEYTEFSKIWPSILLYDYCSKQNDLTNPKVLSADFKVKPVKIDNSEKALADLVEYYLFSTKELSLCHPDLSKKIVENDLSEQELKEHAFEALKEDPYFKNLDQYHVSSSQSASFYKQSLLSYDAWFKNG